MKYFIVEGTLINPDSINDDIMKEHMAYSQKAMDQGLIMMSGLKEDMSGGIFMMKGESMKEVEDYLHFEPFKVNKIQEYKVIEFTPHFINPSPKEWSSDHN